MLIHDGGVDWVGAARFPVCAAGVEHDVTLSGHDHRHRVRVVFVQVLVATTTRNRRPRYRVVAWEIDADDVTSADGDTVLRVEREIAGTNPQRHDDRLSNESVPAANTALIVNHGQVHAQLQEATRLSWDSSNSAMAPALSRRPQLHTVGEKRGGASCRVKIYIV